MTTTAYKLTRSDRTTFGGCLWTVGEWRETSGEGELCGPGWLHYYSHPLVAVVFNRIYGDYKSPILWRGEARGRVRNDRGTKSGATELRILEPVPLPVIPTDARVRFAIYCVRAAGRRPLAAWMKWAKRWLSRADRSYESAYAAAWASDAAADAAYVAAYAAARAAAEAADAAAKGVKAAADASWPAWAAAEAAANAAAKADRALDFAALAERAIRDEGMTDG